MSSIHRRTILKLLPVIVVLFVAGCQRSSDEPAPARTSTATASPTASSETPADRWLGRWQGVEGTYLVISKRDDSYAIEIANLDGTKTYKGLVVDDDLDFRRGDKVQSIRAGTGKDTGMKGLENERNCLVITKGSEGFCRR
jgi:hypothetical protein